MGRPNLVNDYYCKGIFQTASKYLFQCAYAKQRLYQVGSVFKLPNSTLLQRTVHWQLFMNCTVTVINTSQADDKLWEDLIGLHHCVEIFKAGFSCSINASFRLFCCSQCSLRHHDMSAINQTVFRSQKQRHWKISALLKSRHKKRMTKNEQKSEGRLQWSNQNSKRSEDETKENAS